METLLHIDTSPRIAGSVSRQLTASFVARWRGEHPGGRVIVRDLAATVLPHVSEALIGAYYTPADQRSAEQGATIALSDQLVDEVLAADVIVIGAPMHNFGVTSSLKAWVDHVARVGRTFKYTELGPVGLVNGKRAVVVIARGGIFSEGPYQAFDFQTPYIKGVLGFIGITDVELVLAEGLSLSEEGANQAIARCEDLITASAGK
ncbi:MAG: FMN-dependent NADH-azoreductase [Burkholderiales bacterium]|nr:FMN-dependent NADH-azoreductase [Burkholderiales bacterium]